MRKLLSSPAIQFKGTGFYITDYPKKSAPTPGKGNDKSGDAASPTRSRRRLGRVVRLERFASDSTATKTESKPESKAESK